MEQRQSVTGPKHLQYVVLFVLQLKSITSEEYNNEASPLNNYGVFNYVLTENLCNTHISEPTKYIYSWAISVYMSL